MQKCDRVGEGTYYDSAPDKSLETGDIDQKRTAFSLCVETIKKSRIFKKYKSQ